MFRQTRATTVVQPATEVLDSFRVGTAQPQPSVLDGVVGLAHRAEHPVGHGSQTRSVLLESFASHSRSSIGVTFLRPVTTKRNSFVRLAPSPSC
jgi:hypothetical protein